ncbi:O-methyltransferase [Naumannella halotolerans]|uniref:Putative O-methyltransferase YrrM n=1 Tax=Naumannella halotolerans TaxID=993414 RepID=A0A4R7J995_9ACTN|nr:class I SAM-dependent methyltransferase [Naumannella halotolerans]TDT33147.1 putative O-methyltransferase YrrM [Naumannella halotolerans]
MSYDPEVPDLVRRALRSSLQHGYVHATRTETGRLLAALAATRTGTIAECGTGCGVGSAWLRSGAPRRTRVITAELDATLAAGAAETFATDDIDVLQADWTDLSEHAPFSLLFVDAASAKQADRDLLIELVEPGGLIVLDDLQPAPGWPPMVDGRVDVARQEWLADPRLAAVDVLVADDTSVVIATRRDLAEARESEESD